MIDLARVKRSLPDAAPHVERSVANRVPRDMLPPTEVSGASGTPWLVEFPGPPDLRVARVPSSALAADAAGELSLVGADATTVLVHLTDGIRDISASDLALFIPNLSELVICSDPTAGQQWLPTSPEHQGCLEERVQLLSESQSVRITRAFSLAAGLYSVLALAKLDCGNNTSALGLVSKDLDASELLQELQAVRRLL